MTARPTRKGCLWGIITFISLVGNFCLLVGIESLQHGLLIDVKQMWHETILGLISKGCMVLVAGAGLDTKYVPQRMRCYTLNIGQLYYTKLGHVLRESTLLPPAPFPFLTTNDWSVHHSPQKK
jgi:hypothetical protein